MSAAQDRRSKQQLLEENAELREQIKHARLLAADSEVAPEALALSKCIKALDHLDRFQPARAVGYGANQPTPATAFVIRALMSKYRVEGSR